MKKRPPIIFGNFELKVFFFLQMVENQKVKEQNLQDQMEMVEEAGPSQAHTSTLSSNLQNCKIYEDESWTWFVLP